MSCVLCSIIYSSHVYLFEPFSVTNCIQNVINNNGKGGLHFILKKFVSIRARDVNKYKFVTFFTVKIGHPQINVGFLSHILSIFIFYSSHAFPHRYVQIIHDFKGNFNKRNLH